MIGGNNALGDSIYTRWKLEELDMIEGSNALGDSIYTRGETGRARHDRRQQCTGEFYLQ